MMYKRNKPSNVPKMNKNKSCNLSLCYKAPWMIKAINNHHNNHQKKKQTKKNRKLLFRNFIKKVLFQHQIRPLQIPFLKPFLHHIFFFFRLLIRFSPHFRFAFFPWNVFLWPFFCFFLFYFHFFTFLLLVGLLQDYYFPEF